ncbi:hypothetical protein Mc24_07113 [Thermotoga sp. Mc24]|uniref:tRNA (adenosine(37)-N6)-threonylcarbamoyltransferase complex dimerization subunit type 1 TsaB n=1 Tax=Thermotoga sp. Mc24 TaxID=1231241 RepID=UPI000541DC48|nr:tRNA (adenosine(37)-N6)-threonylcarbamoyltransferase complex dimerization subunit type 1 TsaB [Thermotoga sp. Mc24]KHC90680.1 hypothetical protein Mc24_07113 [Thermotoga sp. Mc24]
MNVLALDSSQKIRVGLKKGEDLFEISYTGEKKHAEILPVILEKLLDEMGLKVKDLDVVGVGIGPGGLTGLRVGIATVVGLVSPYDIPVAPLNSFEMAAKSCPIDGVVLVARRARKGYHYCAVYLKGEGLNLLKKPSVVSDDELEEITKEFSPKIILKDYIFISPAVLVEESESLFREKKTIHYYEIEPLYLQKSIAELNWEKKKRG